MSKWRDQVKTFLLGVALTAAAFLWFGRLSKADVYFDPLNDPKILQCSHLMHLEMPVEPDQHAYVASTFRFCQPKSGYHYYPCRCGLVKP